MNPGIALGEVHVHKHHNTLRIDGVRSGQSLTRRDVRHCCKRLDSKVCYEPGASAAGTESSQPRDYDDVHDDDDDNDDDDDDDDDDGRCAC